ncbi:MAG TPA: phosphoribosylanthranilate isomerase [Salinimicrobium catena]|uniref:N-(5'-phosphoribosyl)anthranilate isomerase n=1 Tax=Salinimicrobium catena TaxID=390640 RepID=A0A7C2M5A3_9FLAO|nr:phosphoribosylanthranilate isomerase [Salinimicrobium catena]
MREPQNIREVALLHPDYMGLIFYEASPRHVQEEIEEAPSGVKKTGVFVNAPEEYVLEKVQKYDLSAVQLHGEESAEFCRSLRNAVSGTGKKVELIKVFGVKEEFNFRVLDAYEGIVDLFLFDTKGRNRGGNGITFNWEILKKYKSPTPFFLSGGIGPEEVSEIKKLYRHFEENDKAYLFYGIDVNSKFETAPGLKNAEKLKTFREALFT